MTGARPLCMVNAYCMQMHFCVYDATASTTIIADVDRNASGGFICSSLSAIGVRSANEQLKIASASVFLGCHVFGVGDLSMSCVNADTLNGCTLAIGGNDSSSVDYHLSNDELSNVDITGAFFRIIKIR